MDTDDKPPESGDEIEPVSLRELEMILKPGKPPPPIKKVDLPLKKVEAPRPPRPPTKNNVRTQSDMAASDLAAFAAMSGSTPPPPMVAEKKPQAPIAKAKDAGADEPKAAARAPRAVPKAPTKKDVPAKPAEGPPDSALEDLRALSRASARPRMDSVDFDDLLAMKDDESARALSAPSLPLDLTLLTSAPEPDKGAVDAGWDDPPPPAKAKGLPRDEKDVGAVASAAAEPPQDAEPPPSAPSSARGPSSRRAIAKEGRAASSRPPKSQRGPRTASKAPPPSQSKETASETRTDTPRAKSPSIAPARRDASSVAPQSIPPELQKGRSKLPIFIGVGAVVLALVIYLATRGPSEPTAENKPTATATERSGSQDRTIGVTQPTPTSANTDAVATRPTETTPGPNTTGTRPTDPTGPTPTGTAVGTWTAPTTTPTTAPTTAPTTTPTTTASAQPAGEFNAGAAGAALSSRAGAAAGCKQPGDPSGVARVTVTFAPSGRVTAANVNGPPFAGTKTGGCIAGAMRGATIPPFTGSAQTVSKTVNIP